MKKILPVLLLFSLACKKSNTQPEPALSGYEDVPQAYTLTGASIKEASGIAASKINNGKLWVEQDSGNPPLLYLLQNDGTITDSVLIGPGANRDWEDIAVAGGPDAGKSYLYVADIGDNAAHYTDYNIYRFEEPADGIKTVNTFDLISFNYPDGPHDAEAFLVDENTKDIYIVTKRDVKSRVYRLAYPQKTDALNEAAFVMELNYTGVVSAAVAPDNAALILKTYTQLFYYTKKPADSIAQALAGTPSNLGYKLEAQGEAITFAADGSGFFTLSEEAMGVVPTLNFYRKK